MIPDASEFISSLIKATIRGKEQEISYFVRQIFDNRKRNISGSGLSNETRLY